ncbi:HD domain-containing protein [Candidatus Pacearchaeota archaeon]|nr:HD domain-containing protein [Candidatus Pacearchaeota archaeon]
MLLEDRIYGHNEVKEPVLLKLINSPEIQRLKDVSQLGVPDEFNRFKGFSRYEHSIGVMLLLKYCRANLEEQVAGLLHDISHTAFSHVYDWVLGSNEKEDHQDKVHKKIITNSNIPLILKEYKIDVERISHLENFKILDLNIPDVCADRFDYLVRDPVTTPKLAKYFFKNLRIYDGKLVFSDKKSAKSFGSHFLKAQLEHWGHPETMLRYRLFSEALKMAIQEGTLVSMDFYGGEKKILEKIKNSTNLIIQRNLKTLSGKLNYQINEQSQEAPLKKKFRHVDPIYIRNGGLSRLSETDDSFKQLLKKESESNNLGTKVELIL